MTSINSLTVYMVLFSHVFKSAVKALFLCAVPVNVEEKNSGPWRSFKWGVLGYNGISQLCAVETWLNETEMLFLGKPATTEMWQLPGVYDQCSLSLLQPLQASIEYIVTVELLKVQNNLLCSLFAFKLYQTKPNKKFKKKKKSCPGRVPSILAFEFCALGSIALNIRLCISVPQVLRRCCWRDMRRMGHSWPQHLLGKSLYRSHSFRAMTELKADLYVWPTLNVLIVCNIYACVHVDTWKKPFEKGNDPIKQTRSKIWTFEDLSFSTYNHRLSMLMPYSCLCFQTHCSANRKLAASENAWPWSIDGAAWLVASILAANICLLTNPAWLLTSRRDIPLRLLPYGIPNSI